MIKKSDIKKAFLAHKNTLGILSFDKLKISLLGQGENNRNYLVEVDDKKFTFRIALKAHVEKNMTREARMLKHVPKSIGPQILVFDKSKKVISFVFIILTFIPGKNIMHWSRKEMSMVTQALANLHVKTVSDKAGVWRRKKSLSLYDSHINWIEKDHKKELENNDLKVVWSKIKKEVLAKHDLITFRRSFALIQNDVTPGNVIFNDDKAFVIDWEWAKFGDYATDLTNFFSFSGDFLPWRFGCSLDDIKFVVAKYKKFRGKNFHDPTLFQRVILINELNQFCDMVYSRWRIDNYHKEAGTLSKAKYQSVYKKDLIYFKHKYGVD